MFSHDRIRIDADLESPLRSCGLGGKGLDPLLAYRGGKLVSRRGKGHVRTIDLEVGGETRHYFLKQARAQGWNVLRDLFHRRRTAQVRTTRERDLVELFRRSGFSVMRVVGWGERRRLGWPIAGVLLVERVDGEEYVERYARSNLTQRRVMMRAHGRLVGQLHRTGIDAKLRARDLICRSEDLSDPQTALVVIDRERGALTSAPLSLRRRTVRLAQMWIKGGLKQEFPQTSELCAFLAGYLREDPLPVEDRVAFSAGIEREARELVAQAPTDRAAREVLYHVLTSMGNPEGEHYRPDAE